MYISTLSGRFQAPIFSDFQVAENWGLTLPTHGADFFCLRIAYTAGIPAATFRRPTDVGHSGKVPYAGGVKSFSPGLFALANYPGSNTEQFIYAEGVTLVARLALV